MTVANNLLEQFADEHQRQAIVPHCPTCKNPCCNLSQVVLDMTWQQTQTLYRITSSRREFDESLRGGQGPPAIRRRGTTYYAHGSPCPAFHVSTHACGVYGTAHKPRSCSDFPIYRDGDALTVDARCEAVDVDAIETKLREKVKGKGVHRSKRVHRSSDREFPFLVTFDVE